MLFFTVAGSTPSIYFSVLAASLTETKTLTESLGVTYKDSPCALDKQGMHIHISIPVCARKWVVALRRMQVCVESRWDAGSTEPAKLMQPLAVTVRSLCL